MNVCTCTCTCMCACTCVWVYVDVCRLAIAFRFASVVHESLLLYAYLLVCLCVPARISQAPSWPLRQFSCSFIKSLFVTVFGRGLRDCSYYQAVSPFQAPGFDCPRLRKHGDYTSTLHDASCVFFVNILFGLSSASSLLAFYSLSVFERCDLKVKLLGWAATKMLLWRRKVDDRSWSCPAGTTDSYSYTARRLM